MEVRERRIYLTVLIKNFRDAALAEGGREGGTGKPMLAFKELTE